MTGAGEGAATGAGTRAGAGTGTGTGTETETGIGAGGGAPVWLAALCFVAVVLGVGLRFTALDRKTRSYDESFTGLRIASARPDLVPHVLAGAQGRPATAGDLVAACALRPATGPLDVARSVATFEPHHGPLFFVLAHLWARALGDSTASLRALAALLSSLALPAFYLLGRDALGSRRAGLAALALASLSPLLVAWSQDARPHGLGLTLLAWSTWALVRALAPEAGRGPWIAHALLLGAAVNAYPAAALGAPAHLALAAASAPRGRRRGALLRALGSCAGAAALALPWALHAAAAPAKVRSMLDWTLEETPAASIATGVARTLGRCMLDLGGEAAPHDWLAAAVAAALLAAGLAHLRRARPGAAALGASLAAILLGAAALDLARGARLSTTARHLCAAVLGFEVLFAGAIDGALGSARRSARVLGAAVLAAALAAGAASGVEFVAARYWWTSGGGPLQAALDGAVGRARAAVLLHRTSFLGYGSVLAASYSLPPGTAILEVGGDAMSLPPLDPSWERIALVGPAPSVSMALQSSGYRVSGSKSAGRGTTVEVLERRASGIKIRRAGER